MICHIFERYDNSKSNYSVNVRAIERPSDDEHKALDPVMRKGIVTLVNNDAVRICFSRDGSTKKPLKSKEFFQFSKNRPSPW